MARWFPRGWKDHRAQGARDDLRSCFARDSARLPEAGDGGGESDSGIGIGNGPPGDVGGISIRVLSIARE